MDSTSQPESISVRLRRWFPKPRRRLKKQTVDSRAMPSPVKGNATKETTTTGTSTSPAEIADETEKTKPHPISLSIQVATSNDQSESSPEQCLKRPHSICIPPQTLSPDQEDNGIPETVPLSPITEEPSSTKPSPRLEEDEETGARFASPSSSRPTSEYIDHSCQTDDLPCMSPCSCSSTQPSRESTPSTPPLLTPTGPPPDSWKAWSEGGDSDLPDHITSSLEKISKFQDKLNSDPLSFDSDDEDELAFYRAQAMNRPTRPASGLGAFLDNIPSSPDMDSRSGFASPPSSPSPLRQGSRSSAVDEFLTNSFSPERPQTRKRRDSLETPRSVWAPHQLSAIPEDDEWDFHLGTPKRNSAESDRPSLAPSTPSKSPTKSSPRKTPIPKRKLDEYARVIQPTIIQSIAVYAGAFFRSQKLIDPNMSPEEVRESLEAVLLSGIEDIIGSVPQKEMTQPLRQYFNPYVPDIAEAMVSGLGGPGGGAGDPQL
ncbi:hypothetical protein MKZ38_003073 [Zalerion maritima]|uniref:Uncharacterized protein n=1 Tax=Zalerion maritima TaxID=339359 RepID=A0AAD5WS03_9PEZI|nr:hypothetical protein MKZ38_003073 [Zalerion maritima]